MCLIVIEIETDQQELQVEIQFDNDFDFDRECLEIRVIFIPHSFSLGKPASVGG